jgi:FKBP-type peptidyl-prolyl cis-trans isomerase
MTHARSGSLIAAALFLTACGTQPGTATLETDEQKASYGIGLDMGRNLQPAETRLDREALMSGIEDGLTEAEPAIAEEEIQAALQRFSEAIMVAQQSEQADQAVTNLTEGESYLASNGAKDGVTTTSSGLQYEVLRQGDGPMPVPTDSVRVHYKGTLLDGQEFDSSYGRGEPAVFLAGGLIPGFNEALQMMPVGSHYRIVIPSALAYGANGVPPDIGPNATLIFEMELLGIVWPEDRRTPG